MKSILQGLYAGEVYPDELIMPKDPEYQPVNMKISEQKAYFKQKLSEEDYRKLEEFDNLCGRSSSMDSEASFIYGFRLGAMLMIELFTGKEGLSRNGTDSPCL